MGSCIFYPNIYVLLNFVFQISILETSFWVPLYFRIFDCQISIFIHPPYFTSRLLPSPPSHSLLLSTSLPLPCIPFGSKSTGKCTIIFTMYNQQAYELVIFTLSSTNNNLTRIAPTAMTGTTLLSDGSCDVLFCVSESGFSVSDVTSKISSIVTFF